MKVIERSSKKSQPAEGRGGGLGSLRLGKGLGAELQAQETIISILGRLLDNRFTLVRNVELPQSQYVIPMLLIGPPGVKVLLPVTLRGVYRARLDEWEQMDELRQNFKPATPNLLIYAQQIAEAVQAYLKTQGYKPSSVEAVLVFTDPGVYVEMAKPAARIVLIDALERFIAGLLQSPPYQDRGEVQAMVDAFTRILEAPVKASSVPEQDVFSLVEEQPRSKLPELVRRMPRGDKAVSALNKIPFTTRQWYLLGCLLILNIVILVAFVVFILISY